MTPARTSTASHRERQRDFASAFGSQALLRPAEPFVEGPGIRVRGVEVQRLLQVRTGRGVVAQRPADETKVVVRRGRLRPVGEGLFQVCLGLSEAAFLVMEDAAVQRRGSQTRGQRQGTVVIAE